MTVSCTESNIGDTQFLNITWGSFTFYVSVRFNSEGFSSFNNMLDPIFSGGLIQKVLKLVFLYHFRSKLKIKVKFKENYVHF